MTPLQIELMLHYYSRANDHKMIEQNQLEWVSQADELSGLNLLQVASTTVKHFEITERGKAYVSFLLAVPPPVAAWEIPKFEVKLGSD